MADSRLFRGRFAPRGRLVRLEHLEDRSLLAIASLVGVPNWSDQGPSALRDGQVAGLGAQFDPVAGAIESVAAHPSLANTIFVGTVNGGIWRTTNANTTNPPTPTWTALTDQYPALSISALAFSPLDVNTLYAGTGAVSSHYGLGVGAGVLKSTDGGNHWTQFGADTFRGLRIRSLVPTTHVDPVFGTQNVLAAASDLDLTDGRDDGGVFLSFDAGVNWSRVSGNGQLPLGSVTNLTVDPGNSSRLYAAIAGDFNDELLPANRRFDNDFLPWSNKGVYRSDDRGLTWTNVSAGLVLPEDTDGLDNDGDVLFDANDPREGLQLSTRIELSVGAAAGNRVYAALIRGSALVGVYGSANQGANWTPITGFPTLGQGSLHISMLADKDNADVLWFGGDIPAVSPWVGEIYRVTASTNTWTPVTLAGANGTAPHADSRELIFDAAGRILEADDGGLYQLSNPNTPASRAWTSLNGDLKINEQGSIAYDERNNVVFSGNQDTGSGEQISGNNPAWRSVFLGVWGGQNLFMQGDGNVQAVDNLNPTQTFRYSMGNNFQTFYRRAFTGGNVRQDLVPDAGEPAGVDYDAAPVMLANPATPGTALSGLDATDAGFNGFDRIPYVLNAIDPTRMLIGRNSFYEAASRGDLIQNTFSPVAGDSFVSALAFGGREPNAATPDPNDTIDKPDVFYAARGATVMVRSSTAPATPLTQTTIAGADVIRQIVLDPKNWQVAYAVDSSHVYKTADGGATWDDVSLFLNAHQLRTIELVKSGGVNVILVGGQGGIYRASDPQPLSTWTKFGANLPNTIVSDVHYYSNDDVLVAGTLGRGAWALYGASAAVAVAPALNITGDPTADTIRLVRNAFNPLMLDVFVNNNSPNPNLSVPLASLGEIRVDGAGGDDLFTIDTTQGALELPLGVSFAGGDGDDTLRFTGPAEELYRQGPTLGVGAIAHLGGGASQLTSFTSTEHLEPLLPGELDLIPVLRDGLELASEWSENLNTSGLLASNLPVLGASLGGMLNGTRPLPPVPALPNATQQAVLRDAFRAGGDAVLRRLIEGGVAGFNLAELGQSIVSLDDLQEKLDALDSTPNNVSVSQVDQTTTFDVEVKKTLEGTSALSVSALDDAVTLNGTLGVSADVTLRMVFGVDEHGFFIDGGGAQPLLTVNNIQVSGGVDGGGRFGFLEVNLVGATLTVDPDVAIAIYLHEPGADPITGGTDGLIRPYELSGLFDGMATATITGDPAADDVTLTGTFEVAALLPGDLPPFTLGNAQVTFKWADVNDPATVAVSAVAGPGQELMNFLEAATNQITSGLAAFGQFSDQAANFDLFGVKLAFANQSLGEILGSAADVLTLADANLAGVGSVGVSGAFKRFTLLYSGLDLQTRGVALGDTIVYKDATNVDRTAVVEGVDGGLVTVKFDAALNQTPHATAPSARVERAGSLSHRIRSILGDFSNPLTIAAKIPTLQSLVRVLADQIGVDPAALGLTMSGTGANRVIEFAPTFNLDPITFSHTLDFGAGIPGLEFSAQGDFDFTITPSFRLPLGLRIGPGIPFDERFYLKADAAPEITLTVTAALDNPNIAATIGFLDVRLQEDAAVSPNDGVSISATINVNLTDPGTSGADSRVTFAELLGPNPLNVFNATINGAFDIDGLAISADVGSSNLGQLKISLDGESGAGAPGRVTGLAQLQNVFNNVQITGEENFVNFDNITPEMILNMLSVFVDRLQALGQGGVMGTKIPLINKSLGDIVDLGQALLDKIGDPNAVQSAQAATAKALEAWLNSKLAPLTVSVVVNPGDIRFAFSYGKSYSQVFPLSFDLQGLGSLVTLNASGNLSVKADLAVNLGVGITTAAASVPILERVFFDSAAANEITVGATADIGYDLNNDGDTADPGESGPLTFSAGIVGVPITARDVRGAVRLSLAGDIKSGAVNDGKLTLKEIADAVAANNYGQIIGGNFTGDIQARIPLDGSGNGVVAADPALLEPTDALVLIAGKLQNIGNIQVDTVAVPFNTGAAGAAGGGGIDDPLTDAQLNALGGVFAIDTHNLSGLATGLLNFGDLWSGLDKLLALLQNVLANKVVQQSLPFVGKKLKDSVDFLVDIKTKLNGASASSYDAVRQVLFNLLGPAAGGLNILQLTDNDGTPGIQYTDIQGVNNFPNEVSYDLRLAGTLVNADLPIDFDIGIPGLGLTVRPPSAVNVTVAWAFSLGFGLSKNDGFFFKTNAAEEFDLDLTVSIPGFDAQGELGFLQLNVKDDAAAPSNMNLSFSIDVKDPIGSNNRFTANEIISGGFDLSQVVAARVTGAAHVNLDAKVSFGSADFPSLLADFQLDWNFLNASTDTSALDFGGAPKVAFKNIRLDVGSYFDKFLRPILETVQDVMEPLRPVIDVFTARLPVFTDIAILRSQFDADDDGKVTLLELAKKFNSPYVGFIEAVVYIDALTRHIPSGVGQNIAIDLGDFDLGSADPRAISDLSVVTPNITRAVQDTLAQLGGAAGQFAQDAYDFLTDVAGMPKEAGGPPISFPLFEKPTTAINLLFGRDVDLFLFDMPPLRYDLVMEVFFPLIGPLGVQLVGELHAKADFAFGFDTYGFRKVIETGDFENVFLGLFVSDRKNPDGTGPDVDELSFTGSIDAYGAIDLVVVSAGVGGGLAVEILGNLNDPDPDGPGPLQPDGKVHFDELIENFPECIFDFSGKFTASLSARISVGVWPFKKTWKFKIAETTLVDFSYSCAEPPTPPVLATPLGGGTLRLNMGPDAAARGPGQGSGNDDEKFEVSQKRDDQGDPVAGTVVVKWKHYIQEYVGVSNIVADGGGGNDSILIAQDTLVTSTLSGGSGEDTIVAGALAATLHGNSGSDTLTGSPANDFIYGDDNDDLLIGGDGADRIEGNDGDDELQGQGGNDQLFGQAGSDALVGGEGNDTLTGGATNEALPDRDELQGDAGNDTLRGGADDDVLEGGDGVDNLFGEDGNDFLQGDAGNDTLEGNAGNDNLAGGDNDDVLRGGTGQDRLEGDAGADQLFGEDGDDTLRGGADNDTLRGGNQNDKLYGDSGNDTVRGDAGDDYVSGGLGTDNVYGDAGADQLLGGSGDDNLFGGTQNDTLSGGAGNDQMSGEDGDDILQGDGGNDTLHGNAGADTLFGGDQNDTLYGEIGNDRLVGDRGNDTLFGNEDHDRLEGSEGDDLLYGQLGNDVLYGGAGFDTIEGNEGDDEAHGDSGVDLIHGHIGNDNLFGDTGEDVIYGDENDDTIHGGDDPDKLYGNDGSDTMFGDAADDYLEGNAGNDVISGNSGHDVLYGNDGADVLHGDEDQDVLVGNLGDDQLFGDAGSDRLFGSEGNDTLRGGDQNDFLYGETGADALLGEAGDDLLDGGLNIDNLQGGLGKDVLFGGGGVGDVLQGNEDDDRIFGSDDGAEDPNFGDAVPFGDIIDGGPGNDEIWGLGGADNIDGGDGDDVIDGGAHGDRVQGNFGNDTVFGAFGNDQLFGGNDNDRLYGQQGIDTLAGDAGDDFLDGGTGADVITGGAGRDELLGGGGVGDNLDGGDDDDVLRGSADGADLLQGGAGRDRLLGNAGNDTLRGGAGDDILEGGPGDDQLSGDAGSDVLLGGAQHDTLYGHSTSGAGDDNSVDYAYGDFGTNANETGSGRDRLFGQGGNDILFGEADDDFIDSGGTPTDTVDFGAGESAVPNDFVAPAPTAAPPLSAVDIDRAAAALPTGTDSRSRWAEYALSATGAGLSGDAGLSLEPAIAASNTGGQYVAWVDSRNGNFEIYASRHTAGAWTELAGSAHGGGVSATLGSSRRPSLVLDGAGNPIVTWTEYTAAGSNVFVAQFNPAANGGLGAWVALGTSLGVGGISGTNTADNPCIVMAGAIPVVAWLDSSSGTAQVYVRRFTGGTWQPVSATGASGGGVSNSATSVTDLAIATDGTKLAVVWSQAVGASREIYVREFNGASWVELAASASGAGISNSAGDSAAPTLAYSGGSLFAAWRDNSFGRYSLYAARYNGASWVAAGTGANVFAGLSATRSQSLEPRLTAAGGRLYLSWTEDHVSPALPGESTPPLSSLYVRRWNGSAFVDELPGDSMRQGISPTGGVVQATAFTVDAAGHPFVAWQDAKSGTPEIYVRGNTFDIANVYYVNDSSTTGDQFSTAAGAAANSGLSAASPKASIQQVLDTRDLNLGDVILVDTGTYLDAITIGANDAGARLVGAAGRVALLQGLVTVSVADVTLERLDMAGGATVNSATGFGAFDNRIAGAGLTLNGATNAQIAHNLFSAVGVNLTVSGSASGMRVEDNVMLDGAMGIDYVATSAATQPVFRGNRIDTTTVGIRLNAFAPAEFIANDVRSATGLQVAAPFTGSVEQNAFHGGNVGVAYAFRAALSGNRIYENATGVVSTVGGTTDGFGFVGNATPNDIFNNTLGVQLTGQMQYQHVFANTTGVSGSGVLGGIDLEHANLIEANAIGVNFAGPIQFNRIARNAVGVAATSGQLLVHNLLYRNTEIALRIAGRNDVRVFNNTFYAPAGDNIRIDGASTQVEIRNNVLWAESGYDIYVADDSIVGYFSDYNDLYASGAGKLVYWTRDFSDVLDWQQDVYRFDLNSIGATVVNPLWAEPRFVNRGQDDYRVFDQVARLRFTSPTIDAGDPRTDQGVPPDYINLLANPGFEDGLNGWSATPSGGTRGAAPAPWEGANYFFAQSNAVTTIEQTVSLLAKGYTAAQIDNSNFSTIFGGRVRSLAESPTDRGEITVIYLDGANNELKQITAKAENTDDRWELVGSRQPVPVGTRSVRIRFRALRQAGGENNSYLDGAFLSVESNSEAPNQGGYGNTTHELSQNLAQHLALRSPDLYQDWERDKPLLIRWDSFGNVSNAPIKIDLYQDGPHGPQYVANITPNAPDTGEFPWIAGNSGVNFATHGLRVEISVVGNRTIFGRSQETFTVPENTNTFYVNDQSLTNDEFTSVRGDNRNTGRLADRPKPYPTNVVRIYSLGPTQTLFVDTGDYPLLYPLLVSNVVGLGDDEGFTFTGPTNVARVATLHHANPFTVAPIVELVDADFLTVAHFTLDDGRYGLWAHDGSSNLALSYVTATNHALDGFRIEGASDGLAFDHLAAMGNQRYGIYVEGPLAALRDSVASGNAATGIYLYNPGNAQVEGNESTQNADYGIYVYNAVAGTMTLIGDTDLDQADGNRVHANSRDGIYAQGSIIVAGNHVYNHLGVNDIGLNLQQGAQALRNAVHDNYLGIGGFGGALVGENRVYHNTTIGVFADYGSPVRSNVIYSNAIGVQLGFYFGSQLVNNLIYANLTHGVLVSTGGSALFELINNTIYQTTGDAVRFDPGVRNGRLRNNILWAVAGYDIAVPSDSQQGFASDFNLLYTSGAGQVALWQGLARPTLIAWQNAAFTDSNSLAQDPRFVDPDGADNILGWASAANDGRDDDFHERSLYGSYKGGSLAPVVNAGTGLPAFPTITLSNDAQQSPAIDRGFSQDAYASEPAPNGGYLNLGAYGNTPQASRSPNEYVLVTRPDGGEVWPASQTFPVRWRTNRAASQFALQFDGSNDFVEMGDPANNALDIGASATLEGWVRFDALPSYSFATIASKDVGSGGQNKWIFGYANNYSGVTNATIFHINRAGGGSVFLASNAWTPVVGEWYHLAVVKNGDSYTFYRDGVADGTATTAIQVPDVASTFQVGRAEGTAYLKGSIDTLRLWNVARDAAGVLAGMDELLPANTAGIAGYWRFNEGTGNTANDSSANANHGSLGGGVAAQRPTWLLSDLPSGRVDVELLDGAVVVATLADDTLNDGELLWTIPENTMPGANYSIRVRRSENGAILDVSNAPFTVTAPITVYYVNDGTVEAGDWTTAPGDDGNDGLFPGTPKSSIRAVLEAYDLEAGDVIRVDAGDYPLGANLIITNNDAGVTIEGYHEATFPTRRAQLNRGNTSGGSYVIELRNADGVTLDHLWLTGGVHGVYADGTSDSDHVTVSASTIYGNYDRGVWLTSSNDFATVTTSRFYGLPGTPNPYDDQYRGVVLEGTDGVVSDNLLSDGANEGIYVNGPRHRVTGNEVYRYGNAVYAYNGGVGADRVLVQNNRVHDNRGVGIYGQSNVLIVGNTVYGQAGSGQSGIYASTSTEVRGNTVYGNYYGLVATSDAVAVDNTVFDNLNYGLGMHDSSQVRQNRSYNNAYGLYVGFYASGEASGNLLYQNRAGGILVESAGSPGVDLFNNTVVQVGAGQTLRVQGGTRNVFVENNILWAGAGVTALSVAPDSQFNFNSDYNLFWTPDGGVLGQWENRNFTNRVDWFYEVGLDQHSRVADPLFVDPDGPDNQAGYRAGGLTAEYFNNETLTGAPVLTRAEAAIDFLWYSASPAPGTVNVDNFSVRWTGYVYAAEAGSYTFYSLADDGERFYLDGNPAPLIDQWTWDGGLENAVTVELTPGWHALRYELHETTGYAAAQLSWSGPHLPKQIIDERYLTTSLDVSPGNYGADDDFHLRPGSPAIDAGTPLSYHLSELAPSGDREEIGAYGNTPGAFASPARLVQMLSPNGLEKFEQGQQVNVQWRSAGLTAQRPVALINAGGPTMDNYLAEQYLAGSTYTVLVANAIDLTGVAQPAPEGVYQSYRYLNTGTPGDRFGYSLPVPDGGYTVRLHFMEPSYTGINQRKFDIRLQGALVQDDYDVFAAAGAMFKATALSFPVSASGGSGILLELVNVLGAAFLCGIELLADNPLGTANPTVNLELSSNNGANWTTIANGLAMDRFGRGSYLWTIPANQAIGSQYKVRAVAVGAAGVNDPSDEPFSIANNGVHYYVNDSVTTGDVFTTAMGNNASSGKTPADPMASLFALLAAYDLDPADIIHVDAGEYRLMRNTTLVAQDSGVRIEGPSGAAAAVLNRGNTAASNYVVELQNADGVTLDHLTITGGVYGVFGWSQSDSDDLTISNSIIHGNSDRGIYLLATNDAARIADNTVYGLPAASVQTRGIVIENTADAVITGNTVYDSANEGIIVYNGPRHRVENNQVYGNGTGIYAYAGGVGADRIVVRENTAHDNTGIGIYAQYNVLVVDNTVFNQAGASDYGIYASQGAEIRENVVRSNYYGIRLDSSAAIANQVFNNSNTGIFAESSSFIDGNKVYSNSVGLRTAYYFLGQITNNLIYANTNQGILFQSTNNYNQPRDVLNNTIYQLVGDAVRLESGTSHVKLRNNIIWVQAGYDISVANDSQVGFESNYNLLHQGSDANAHVGFWAGVIRDSLDDWRAASAQDALSLAGDPLFVDLDGADNTLGYAPVGGGFRDGGPDDNFYRAKFSPATDRGDSWNASTTDLEGFRRVDDPGTANAGSNDYFATSAGTSQFATTGVARNWRSNNTYFNYTLPFAFSFYGTTYSSVYVTTEGYLQFGDASLAGDGANDIAKLSARRRLAPLWDNLLTHGVGDDIFIDESVANQVTIRWNATNEVDSSDAQFAVVLFSDGRFRFDYGPGNNNLTPTVGVSSGNGRATVTAPGYDGAASLSGASSLTFLAQPGIVDIGAYEFRGSSLDVTAPRIVGATPTAVFNSGTTAAHFDVVRLEFSEEMNPIDGNAPANFELRNPGPNAIFGDADDKVYGIAPRYVHGSTFLDLELPEGELPNGAYRLTVYSNLGSSIHDLAGLRLDGDANGTSGGDFVRNFMVSHAAPTADIVDVAPDPRGSAVETITITFSKAVTGFDRSDLRLTRSGSADLLTAAQTLTTADNITWTLGNLTSLTSDNGAYLLELVAASAGIIDLDGNALIVSAADNWIKSGGLPGDTNGDNRVDVQDLNNIRNNFGASGPGVLGDTNGDNRVDVQDLNAVRNNFGAQAVTVPGDTNGDRRVDVQDLNNVRNNFGAAGPGVPGDSNGDNRVDVQDLNAVRNNFGATGSPVPPSDNEAMLFVHVADHVRDLNEPCRWQHAADALFANGVGFDPLPNWFAPPRARRRSK